MYCKIVYCKNSLNEIVVEYPCKDNEVFKISSQLWTFNLVDKGELNIEKLNEVKKTQLRKRASNRLLQSKSLDLTSLGHVHQHYIQRTAYFARLHEV